MILLMTGWMFLFMGLLEQQIIIFCIGLCLIVFNVWCIRT
jgi:hypothetical protein